LFPQKLAAPATPANVALAAKINNQRAEQLGRPKIAAQTAISRLSGMHLTFTEPADESGTFFAGVTRELIASALNLKGIGVKSKQIILAQPIKTAGRYHVPVSVGGQTVEITITATNQ